MGLAGQEQVRSGGERGYAMAALLIALAVMAIVMSVAMPVWRHEAQREKEAELIFRGEQYARAIALYRRKNMQAGQAGNLLPPSIDVLIDGRFLRKKYKDPMTKDGEFMPMQFGQQTPGPNPPQNPPGGRGVNPPSLGRSTFPPTQQTGPGMAIAGIAGVRSKSQDTSIRSYRGQTRYDQWAFLYTNLQIPGGAMPMANTPDGRGNTPNTFPGTGGSRGTGPRGTGPRGNNPPGGFNPPGTGFPQPPGRRGGAPGGRGPGQ